MLPLVQERRDYLQVLGDVQTADVLTLQRNNVVNMPVPASQLLELSGELIDRGAVTAPARARPKLHSTPLCFERVDLSTVCPVPSVYSLTGSLRIFSKRFSG